MHLKGYISVITLYRWQILPKKDHKDLISVGASLEIFPRKKKDNKKAFKNKEN